MVNDQPLSRVRWAMWQLVCTLGALLILISVWVAHDNASATAATDSPTHPVLSAWIQAQELLPADQTLNAGYDTRLQDTLEKLSVLADEKSTPNDALLSRLRQVKAALQALQTAKDQAAKDMVSPTRVTPVLQNKASSAAGKELWTALNTWTRSLQGATELSQSDWTQLSESQAAWATVTAAWPALEDEVQRAASKSVKGPKEFMASLTAALPPASLEAHTQALHALLQARTQLEQSLTPPPTAQELAAARPWNWRRLGFPAAPQQGLLWATVLLVASLACGWAARRFAPRVTASPTDLPPTVSAQDRLAHKQWLSLLLHQREEAESALAHLQAAGDQLGEVLLASHEPLFQLIWQAQTQTPTLTHAQAHLQQASAAHHLLLDDVQRLTEKLVNVHLQFCQGTHQDNLMYDLAYLAEAFKGLQTATEQLGHILAQGAQPVAEPGPRPDQAFAERLDAWRAQLHQVTRQLHEAQASLEKSLKNATDEAPRASVFPPEMNG